MATYKVIQDIEAEDKLLGPLTLRQFIYACIAAICLYLSFLSLTKHLIYFLALLIPVAGMAAFFAFPWSRDQPTEVWALAKIRFLLKPHRRIWDQSGAKELVTITVPKRTRIDYTDGLSQAEVTSRLRALADTIDSRGWAIKNVNVNLYSQPSALMSEQDSDRLIDVASLPQDVPQADVNATDDIFESSVADHFGQMITANNESHRQQIMQQLHQAAAATTQTAAGGQAPPNDYWFLNQPQPAAQQKPGYTVFNTAPVVHPGAVTASLASQPTAAEKALSEQLKFERRPSPQTSHLHTIQPLSAQLGQSSPSTVTQHPDPAILGLASDNDKNVATIARMANEAQHPKKVDSSEDEVVISLH